MTRAQSSFRTWMLPEGVVEALPVDAQKLNRLEQLALDTFKHWGYQPLRPPMVEYADTFIVGDNSNRLSEQTIQFKDQKSGKQLGFRADLTPQISRIDAHYLKTDKVSRYAYAGEVVRSYPAGHGSARNPTIVGAELLGSASSQADIEVVSLLITYLNTLALSDYVIELGNIDIVVALLEALGVPDERYQLFFEALAKKDNERLAMLATECGVETEGSEKIQVLTELYGDTDNIENSLVIYQAYPTVVKEIERLKTTLSTLKQRHPEVKFNLDFSDVHGYGYHNGLIFSAYVDKVWQPIARGGRYDGFGNHFGVQKTLRPSIGFSCHLNLIIPLFSLPEKENKTILCRLGKENDELLNHYINELRHRGDIVIMMFDDDIYPYQTCTHEIVETSSGFAVQRIDE